MTYIKLYSGENWYPVPLKVHDGKGWKQATMKRFNGTSWEKVYGASDQEGIFDMTYYVEQSQDDGQEGYQANTNGTVMSAFQNTFTNVKSNAFFYINTENIPSNAKIISASLHTHTTEIYTLGPDLIVGYFLLDGYPEKISKATNFVAPKWNTTNLLEGTFNYINKNGKTLFNFFIEIPGAEHIQKWSLSTFESTSPNRRPYLEITYSIGI